MKCVVPEGDDTWKNDEMSSPTITITDAATCKTVMDEYITWFKEGDPGSPDGAVDTFSTEDWCFQAAVQAASDGVEASVTCEYFTKAKADPSADIRVATPEKDGLVYTAWAYGAGEPLADLVAAAEGDADSAKMITSALAAVATIAMVAY